MVEKLQIGLILQGGASWVGGAEYSRNLIKALYRLPEDQFESHILSDGPIDRQLYADMPPRFWRELHENLATTQVPFWLRAAHRLAPERFPGGSALVRHAWRLGVQFLYPFNRPTTDYGRIDGAAWIPDWQHRSLPEFFSDDERRERDETYAGYVANASAVVVSSDTAARDLRIYCPAAADKTCVLRFRTVLEDGWHTQDAAATARKYGLAKRFFIVCNQFWKHKNHLVVFKALSILKERGIAPQLVCTGKLEDYRHPTFAGEVMRMIESAGIGAQVRLLGLLPRSDQIQLLRCAAAVIQPSLCEGWSTVVEDCRALGKRVALSDIPVHREQDPPFADFFDPLDAEQLATLLGEWWHELPGGPDRVVEEAALVTNARAAEEFGQRFLALAQA